MSAYRVSGIFLRDSVEDIKDRKLYYEKDGPVTFFLKNPSIALKKRSLCEEKVANKNLFTVDLD
jgi:hypothetical protein